MVHTRHLRGAFRREPSHDETRAGAKVRRHHRRADQALDPFDGRDLSVEMNACAETREFGMQMLAARRMVERTTLSATGRIYAELLRQANEADGRTIRPLPTMSELALIVQSTRETVSRTINDLERRGYIDRKSVV